MRIHRVIDLTLGAQRHARSASAMSASSSATTPRRVRGAGPTSDVKAPMKMGLGGSQTIQLFANMNPEMAMQNQILLKMQQNFREKQESAIKIRRENKLKERQDVQRELDALLKEKRLRQLIS